MGAYGRSWAPMGGYGRHLRQVESRKWSEGRSPFSRFPLFPFSFVVSHLPLGMLRCSTLLHPVALGCCTSARTENPIPMRVVAPVALETAPWQAAGGKGPIGWKITEGYGRLRKLNARLAWPGLKQPDSSHLRSSLPPLCRSKFTCQPPREAAFKAIQRNSKEFKANWNCHRRRSDSLTLNSTLFFNSTTPALHYSASETLDIGHWTQKLNGKMLTLLTLLTSMLTFRLLENLNVYRCC